jgi:hypothetical protein
MVKQIAYVVSNRGPYREGNQIDMPRGSRVFFGFPDAPLPRNSPIGQIQIRYGDHAGLHNLRFGNNQMDKLDLPIPNIEGPFSYRNSTLLFVKEGAASFQLAVGTATTAARWRAKSDELNC